MRPKALLGRVSEQLADGDEAIAALLQRLDDRGERRHRLAAVAAAVVVSAFADRSQRPLGVLGLVLALMALCWWVFVRQLSLRVPVWPLGWTP